jgi:L-lactate dehydrogenase complex protein LldG
MSGSRDALLRAIRRHAIEPVPLPDLDAAWITFPDPRLQFADTLSAVGGQLVTAASPDQLNRHLDTLPACQAARRIVSTVPGVGRATIDLAAIDDPHQLDDLDLAILPGEFAVAENAAVWVTDAGLTHRAVYFLCQHLVLVVPAAAIVHNLHEAYTRLGGAAFAAPSFGAFISGPSKTADIEQSLVIGAHGPRSLLVCLVG